MKYTGEVIHGLGEAGVTYALPTANIYVEGAPEGIFVGQTKYLNSWYPSLICIRVPGDRQVLESHLFDFEGDIYHETIEVDVGQRIRPLVPFTTVEDMHALIEKDVQTARRLLDLPVRTKM